MSEDRWWAETRVMLEFTRLPTGMRRHLIRARDKSGLEPDPPRRTDAALLVLRLAVGVTFLAHGLDKLADFAAPSGSSPRSASPPRS